MLQDGGRDGFPGLRNPDIQGNVVSSTNTLAAS